MADLKDLIKNAQTGFVADVGKGTPKEKPKIVLGKKNKAEDDHNEQAKPIRESKKQEAPSESVAAAIRSMDRGAVLDKVINVRISDSVHRKLRLYGQENLKVQWIVSYAINRLLETEEMKSLFDKIKKDMGNYA